MNYEIKSPLGENLFFSIDEIVFELNARFNYDAKNSDILSVIQNKTIIFLLSFEDIIKKIQLLKKG